MQYAFIYLATAFTVYMLCLQSSSYAFIQTKTCMHVPGVC